MTNPLTGERVVSRLASLLSEAATGLRGPGPAGAGAGAGAGSSAEEGGGGSSSSSSVPPSETISSVATDPNFTASLDHHLRNPDLFTRTVHTPPTCATGAAWALSTLGHLRPQVLDDMCALPGLVDDLKVLILEHDPELRGAAAFLLFAVTKFSPASHGLLVATYNVLPFLVDLITPVIQSVRVVIVAALVYLAFKNETACQSLLSTPVLSHVYDQLTAPPPSTFTEGLISIVSCLCKESKPTQDVVRTFREGALLSKVLSFLTSTSGAAVVDACAFVSNFCRDNDTNKAAVAAHGVPATLARLLPWSTNCPASTYRVIDALVDTLMQCVPNLQAFFDSLSNIKVLLDYGRIATPHGQSQVAYLLRCGARQPGVAPKCVDLGAIEVVQPWCTSTTRSLQAQATGAIQTLVGDIEAHARIAIAMDLHTSIAGALVKGHLPKTAADVASKPTADSVTTFLGALWVLVAHLTPQETALLLQTRGLVDALCRVIHPSMQTRKPTTQALGLAILQAIAPAVCVNRTDRSVRAIVGLLKPLKHGVPVPAPADAPASASEPASASAGAGAGGAAAAAAAADSKGPTCPICLMGPELTDPDGAPAVAVYLPCFHYYHRACLIEHLKHSAIDKCAMCAAPAMQNILACRE